MSDSSHIVGISGSLSGVPQNCMTSGNIYAALVMVEEKFCEYGLNAKALFPLKQNSCSVLLQDTTLSKVSLISYSCSYFLTLKRAVPLSEVLHSQG